MGECIISRASNGSDTSSSGPGAIAYYNNGQFVVPKTGTYHVEAIGGGGGAGGIDIRQSFSGTIMNRSGGAGGNGYTNKSMISINKNNIYSVSIGSGGIGGSGNTTTISYVDPYEMYYTVSNAGNAGGTSYFGQVSVSGGSGAPYARQSYMYTGKNFYDPGMSYSNDGTGGDGTQGGYGGSPGGAGATGNPGWCYISLYSS